MRHGIAEAAGGVTTAADVGCVWMVAPVSGRCGGVVWSPVGARMIARPVAMIALSAQTHVPVAI
jgi:hypothetical protein